jgi:long-chain fatty acid transport protein
MQRIPSAGMLLAVTFSPLAHATHGMNMDAYGAKAGGMGGAAMAYDSGNSAVMNNPATLGLRPEGRTDFGLGLTVLKPDVTASHPLTGKTSSDGDAYYMPSISWMHRGGAFTYGVASRYGKALMG